MEPEKIVENLTHELNTALKAMSKTKDLSEKEAYSRIVKNLCDSLSVFFDLANEMMPMDYDDEDE